jgi:lipocalin-like protein
MNRHSTFILTTISAIGLAVLSSDALAQAKPLKEELIGAWTLVSYERMASGTKQTIANPKGILMFDAGGRYVMAGERGDRPKFKSAGQATTEELAAATQDFFAANFGTWSVTEADRILTQHFDGALRPNNEGTDVKSSVRLAGDELKLTNIMPLPTGASIEQVYRRAK